MKSCVWRLTRAGLLALLVASDSPTHALELLTAGDFEGVYPEVPGWTLEEFRTGQPANLVDSARLVAFANHPNGAPAPAFGLWLLGFAGDPFNGTAEAILSQTAPATPGETYTLSGDALFEAYYAGGLDFLDPISPFGAIPSPTESLFELAFLDAGGGMIGAPLVRDVAAEIVNGGPYSSVTPLVGVAPAGAASVRVRAIASQLANSGLNPQSAFYDNFSLIGMSDPSNELLVNGGLNQPPITTSDFFEFVETPAGANTVQIAGAFANNPATGGANGMWVRPFIIDAETAAVRQTVPAVEGNEYTFTASARWELNYLGDDGSGANETYMELAFLDAGGMVIDSVILDLRAEGKTADNTWTTHSLSAIAPAGAVSVRVGGVVDNLTNNLLNMTSQSAFWDDFSLTTVPEPSAGLLALLALGAGVRRR